MIKKIISSENDMLSLGRWLSQQIYPGDVVFLEGNLGSGKTTLVRGILLGLQHSGFVPSPTYSLLEVYPLSYAELVHVDLYRLTQAVEFHHLGLSDYCQKSTIILIEWPNRFYALLPRPAWTCHIEVEKKTQTRLVTLQKN